MSGEELFLELKRALSPLGEDQSPYRRPEQSLAYESARSQVANVSIEEEGDDFLKINGLLYSFLSLKELPDATFPGLLRELMIQDLPPGRQCRVYRARPGQGDPHLQVPTAEDAGGPAGHQ